MPLMSLAATAIDQPKHRAEVIDTLLQYLPSDVVLCRDEPGPLARRQAEVGGGARGEALHPCSTCPRGGAGCLDCSFTLAAPAVPPCHASSPPPLLPLQLPTWLTPDPRSCAAVGAAGAWRGAAAHGKHRWSRAERAAAGGGAAVPRGMPGAVWTAPGTCPAGLLCRWAAKQGAGNAVARHRRRVRVVGTGFCAAGLVGCVQGGACPLFPPPPCDARLLQSTWPVTASVR